MTTPPPDEIQDRYGMPVDRKELDRFCLRYHVKRLSVVGPPMGSAPGRPADVEMLIEFMPGKDPGRFVLVSMQIELSDLAGRRLDLRTYDELKASVSRKRLASARTVYAA